MLSTGLTSAYRVLRLVVDFSEQFMHSQIVQVKLLLKLLNEHLSHTTVTCILTPWRAVVLTPFYALRTALLHSGNTVYLTQEPYLEFS